MRIERLPLKHFLSLLIRKYWAISYRVYSQTFGVLNWFFKAIRNRLLQEEGFLISSDGGVWHHVSPAEAVHLVPPK